MLGFINKNKILTFFAAMAATQISLYLSIHLFVTTQTFTENMNYVHYCDVRYLLSTTIYISTQHIMIITSITRPV